MSTASRLKAGQCDDRAYPLASGQVVRGRIDPAGDIDFFKILVLRSGVTLTVTLADLPANDDLYLDKPDQSSAAVSRNTGTQSEVIAYTVDLPIGYYYVVVLSPSGAFTTATYTLQARVDPAPTVFRTFLPEVVRTYQLEGW